MTVNDNPGCKTYSESMYDQRDFQASAVVDLPKTDLPKAYSLGRFVAKTNYQNGWGSCTANSTCHALQTLAVMQEFGEQNQENKLTPDWRDLWTKMGHDLNDKNDSGDYIETAIKTAIKGVKILENGEERSFKGYSFQSYTPDEESFELIKKYLYNGHPLQRAIQGNRTTWNEMQAGEVKTIIPGGARTGGHAICCVGYDEGGLWFLNSWIPNDSKGMKSRFYISFETLKKM